jgi:hypothetical protein
MLAMPTHRAIYPWTVQSLIKTRDAMAPWSSIHFYGPYGCSMVATARNKVAQAFLEGKCDRLFWIDSDMVWQPSDFLRVMELSEELECVGAVYPLKSEPIRFFLDLETGETNEWGCASARAFGLGFTCVQRKVMEELAAKAPKILLSDETVCAKIFRTDEIATETAKRLGADAEERGEDAIFFSDVRALGYKVWIDPSIKLGHVGPKIYEGCVEDLVRLAEKEAKGAEGPPSSGNLLVVPDD